MRLLVPGGGGMVARMLGALAPSRGHEAVLVPHAEWDVADPAASEAMLKRHRPDAVVNCAGFTNVDACESRPGEAFRANAEGPRVLAGASAAHGAPFLHLSTDYVFDGTARVPYAVNAPTGPVSAYGRSKLAGEEAVAEAVGHWIVLRTAWVYGPWGRHFPGAILKLAREQGRLRVVDDQVGSPTYTADLAGAVLRLLEVQARGVVHFTNAGACSWHRFAEEILRRSGLDVPVEAVPSSAFPRPARRPSYSVLSTARYASLTGHAPRPWEEALAEFLLNPDGPPGRMSA